MHRSTLANIRRPLVGHQAVKRSFEVYNSIASIDRLQTSKYIALLTSMFTASFSAFKSSCNLFLCCYRAAGSSFYPPRHMESQIVVSPGIPPKSIVFSSSLCFAKGVQMTVFSFLPSSSFSIKAFRWPCFRFSSSSFLLKAFRCPFCYFVEFLFFAKGVQMTVWSFFRVPLCR